MATLSRRAVDVIDSRLWHHLALGVHPACAIAAYKDGELVVKGTYSVVEDQLTFNDEEGLLACRAGQARGLYKWALDDDTLSLTPIEDQCDGRKVILAAHPFARLP